MPLSSVRVDHFHHFEAGAADFETKVREIVMSVLGPQLAAIQEKLSEASTEIVDLINQLSSRPDVSAEDQATLDAIKAQAEGLANIVTNDPPTE